MHGPALTAARGIAAAAIALLALAGCGEDPGGPEAGKTSTPSASPSTSSGAPDCTEIWQDGAQLPRAYGGCNSTEGFVAADKLGCSSGQRMVRHSDHFYAVLGGTIHETESLLEDDRGYRGAVASCRA